MGTIQSYQVTIPQDIVQHWGWFLAFGIALVVLGVAALARAFSATIATMVFFGWRGGSFCRDAVGATTYLRRLVSRNRGSSRGHL